VTEKETREGVRVVDVDMPFGSMVKFMVKWAIASIPALIILMVIGGLVGGAIAGFTSGLFSSSGASALTALRAPLGDSSASSTPSTPVTPQWELSESSNPIDDSPVVVLSLDASSPQKTILGAVPTLILRCKSKRTEAYITWSTFLGTDAIRVTTRIGHEPASTRSWSLSSDNQASFYPGDTRTFIKQLAAADTLVAMTTPYNESPVTAIFTITGLEAKVEPLRKACAWQ
jgi:type VI secretion system protein VasI